MKRINAFIISTLISSAALFAQEMPADLDAKLQTKSAEINAGNASAAKSWLRKQKNAWETIQNMAFSGDENDIKLIKSLAEKQFPMDFVKQESFLNQQSSVVSGLPEYKVALGKDGYEAVRKKFLDSGNTDLNALVDVLSKQSAAKSELDLIKPAGDEMTFAITKEVISKKFPGDYAAQLEALKKQLAKSAPAAAPAANNSATTITANAATTVEQVEVKKETNRPLNVSELNKLTRDIFAKVSFVVEGSKKSTGIAAELDGKQVVILPFTAYDPDSKVSIMNNLGEEVVYTDKEVFASKTLPLMVIFPKTLPADSVLIKAPTEKIYRELVGKQVFFVGFTSTNIQSFPLKINAIGDEELILSTKIPATFQEGTILVSPESETTLGLLTISNPIVKEVNWSDRSAVNRFFRMMDYAQILMHCIRIDKIDDLEKVESDRFKAEAAKIKEMREFINDLTAVFLDTRFDEITKTASLSKIASRHKPELMRKQDKSRYNRICSNYLRDITTEIKMRTKKYEPEKYYSAHKVRAVQYGNILKTMYNTLDKGLRSNNFMEFIPSDSKRAQAR